LRFWTLISFGTSKFSQACPVEFATSVAITQLDTGGTPHFPQEQLLKVYQD